MIVTIWPAGVGGRPGNDWRQGNRWLVLDVTRGLGSAVVLAGPMTRVDAHAEMHRWRKSAS